MADQEPRETPLVDIWNHTSVRLEPDASRTVLRPFLPAFPDRYAAGQPPRAQLIVDRLIGLDERTLMYGIDALGKFVEDRHRNVPQVLLRRFDEVRQWVPAGAELDEHRKIVIGGFFSEEYAFEAAALFNPSIVRHWDQSGLNPGAIRFVMSLRGIGEGHVSSVTFRTGVWEKDGSVVIDAPSPYAAAPLMEPMEGQEDEASLCLYFDDIGDVCEAILFPMAPSQKQGIEDLRLVQFTEEDGSTRYLGTYTAFDGRTVRQEILATEDFRRFQMRPLTGKVAENKGMALFPRRIDGRYVMLGRQDNESIWLMTSDDLYHWDTAEKIVSPEHPWEFVQMGNCGSPIEIDEGWLVLTHGVGLMRNYTISACLLDKQDPRKVLGRSRLPLLSPAADQRDGYVPNVVYSCGALVDGRRMLLPYGVADNFTAIATTNIDSILAWMA